MKYTQQQRHYQTVEKALAYIQREQLQQPSLADIADHCSLSEFHFQRVFSQWAGVSPKQFLQYLTRDQAKVRLLDGDDLLTASNASGLSSSSRLHDLFITLDAVTPGQIKSGGNGIRFYYGLHNSPFGECFVVITDHGIHQLEFINKSQLTVALSQLQQQWPNAEILENTPLSRKLIKQIFVPRKNPEPLKLWIQGSQFQFKVWEALLRIPSGSLCSYAAIASNIGQPLAARAVGSAIAKNPVAWLIPCHRVIQSMGTLGNYRWGEIRKQALVGWEAGGTGD
jgi:AraC family transcriptional regulator, regulatory protein of adaptative response / methylated-DNA-[protein]-cysteine methyltransferase